MHKNLKPALLALSLLVVSPNAYAWSDFGHMEVAAVAYKQLTRKVKTRVAQLLKLNPSYAHWIVGAKPRDQDRVAFMRAATWADAIKSDPGYQDDTPSAPTSAQNIGYADRLRHAYWHYVNLPFSADGTQGSEPATPNVATQIHLLRATLGAAQTSEDIKSYDLVWLLHLVGDVHQPLHCVARFDVHTPTGDRGGGTVKITGNRQPPVCDDPRFCPYGPPADLHAFFDTIVGSGYGTAAVEQAAARLPAPDPALVAIVDVNVWIQEGLDLAKRAIYVSPIGLGNGPFTITETYQAAALALGKQRIALAGHRLARLLNQALHD